MQASEIRCIRLILGPTYERHSTDNEKPARIFVTHF
jgi:hypothetical protein